MEEVIHVETQEEWDIVTKYYKIKWNDSNNFSAYTINSCINYKINNYSKISFYYGKSKIIEFKEWYKLINKNVNMIKEQGMQELMLDVLNKTYDNLILRRTTVPLFMSNPGIGKSTITDKFAADKGVKIHHTILSTRMPNEVAGGVMPNAKLRCWEIYDNLELSSLKDGDIWFIDETFNGTLKQTLDSLLNVIESRRLPSGKKLADIMIIAASNHQGLISLTPQIKQRFIKYDLKFNGPEYQTYLQDKYGIPSSISHNLVTLINKEKFDSASWNYITPRSVEKAINQIGCDLLSAYDDLLLPILTNPVEATIDLPGIKVKKGESFDYLPILKQIIKYNNDKEAEKVVKQKSSLVN